MAAYNALALLALLERKWRVLGPPKRRRGRPRMKPAYTLLTGPPLNPWHRPAKNTPEIRREFLLAIESLRFAYGETHSRRLFDREAIRAEVGLSLIARREEHWRAQGLSPSLSRELAVKDVRVDERRVRSLAVLLSQTRRAMKDGRLRRASRAELRDRRARARETLLTAEQLDLLP